MTAVYDVPTPNAAPGLTVSRSVSSPPSSRTGGRPGRSRSASALATASAVTTTAATPSITASVRPRCAGTAPDGTVIGQDPSGRGGSGGGGGGGGRALTGPVATSGGAGEGCLSSASSASWIAVSSCASRPAAQSSGVFSTSTSGSTP